MFLDFPKKFYSMLVSCSMYFSNRPIDHSIVGQVTVAVLGILPWDCSCFNKILLNFSKKFCNVGVL